MAQQDPQHLHRARSQAVAHRTALANQIRGFLLEYGLIIPKGIHHLRRQRPEILEDGDNGLSIEMRALLAELREELVRMDERVGLFDQKLVMVCRESRACRRLQTIPGIGPKVATALIAAVSDASTFRNGREMAAWLGLVPHQCSTGGRPVLRGISKRGDGYLRTLVIHGARAALRTAAKRDDRQSRWACRVAQRRGQNVAIVAVANKNIRTAWALLTRDAVYQAEAVWAKVFPPTGCVD